jgi:hypothetical protein
MGVVNRPVPKIKLQIDVGRRLSVLFSLRVCDELVLGYFLLLCVRAI